MTWFVDLLTEDAPPAPTCYLLDTFTDADGTALSDHTPEQFVGDFAWYDTATITSNRVYGPASASSFQGYKSAYDALGVTAPWKATFVALCESAGSARKAAVEFQNADNTTKIIIELGGLGFLTVTALDATTEVNDIASGVAADAEHTIEVIFEAQRFQVIIDGTPRPAVDFGSDIPVDMVTAIGTITASSSYIDLISVCPTDEEIVDVTAFMMDFEGIAHSDPVDDFYAAQGITFTGATAIVYDELDDNQPPSPPTAIWSLTGPITVSVPGGFITSVTLWHFDLGTVTVEVRDASNNVLTTTPISGVGSWSEETVPFTGVGATVTFTTTGGLGSYQLDNITLILL
jgi:hypothetical protein